MRNFRKFEVWIRAIKMSKEIYLLTNLFPKHEVYGLVSQMQRSSVSIAANIAEGASRTSDKDFARFLEISLGSAFELETHVTIALELKYITNEKAKEIDEELNHLQRQLSKLILTIRNN